MIATLLLAATLGQCPQPPCAPPVVYFPPRYAIVQPPAYYIVPPPVLVQPPPYAVQVGPRVVPRRPFLAWLGFPVHDWVVTP